MKTKKHFKQKVVAAWAGISESHLSELKAGKRNVSRNLALKISDKTGKPWEKVFCMTGPRVYKILISHFKKAA